MNGTPWWRDRRVLPWLLQAGVGLVVLVLREAGVQVADAAVVKGADWLLANQRQSGRWFTQSLNNDRHHYIANAGSAYAVLALEAAGKLKREVKAGE